VSIGHKKKQMTFIDWINYLGTVEIAKLLKVETATVRQWRRGYCSPKVEHIRQIKILSKGLVSYEAIIDGVPPHEKPRTL